MPRVKIFVTYIGHYLSTSLMNLISFCTSENYCHPHRCINPMYVVWKNSVTEIKWGMRHTLRLYTSTERQKKSLHKPMVTFGNMLFQINYGFNCYLQILCLQFLSKTHLNLSKSNYFDTLSPSPPPPISQSAILDQCS